MLFTSTTSEQHFLLTIQVLTGVAHLLAEAGQQHQPQVLLPTRPCTNSQLLTGTLCFRCSARPIKATSPLPSRSETHACRLHRGGSRPVGRCGYHSGGNNCLFIQLIKTLLPLPSDLCVPLLLQGQPHHLPTLWQSHCKQIVHKSAPAPTVPGPVCAERVKENNAIGIVFRWQPELNALSAAVGINPNTTHHECKQLQKPQGSIGL